MKIVQLLVSSVFLSSCASLVPLKKQVPRKVELHGIIHKPYCGGAKPSPDVAAGYYEPLRGIKYNIFASSEFSNDLPIFKEFTFDENGKVDLIIPPGNYVVMRADKHLPLDQFIKLNSQFPNNNYRLKDNQCFTDWKNRVDLQLIVTNDTIIEFIQNAKCWIGTNSCAEYIGPPAP